MKNNNFFTTKQSIYSLEAVENIINKYCELGGECIEVVEGCLGYGITICMANGYKTAVIKEIYLNEWSSGHTIRFYNKTPKKYLDMIDNL